MFEQIKNEHSDHILNIECAFTVSTELGLSPLVLTYRALDENDFKKLFELVDKVLNKTRYDYISGGCLYVHSYLKLIFSEYGYNSELVFGDVIVNNIPYMECTLESLKEQLKNGKSSTYQDVHCWLLLENGQFFDATLYRDLTDGKYAAELYCFKSLNLNNNTFEYNPMLVGSKFIEKTSPNPYIG